MKGQQSTQQTARQEPSYLTSENCPDNYLIMEQPVTLLQELVWPIIGVITGTMVFDAVFTPTITYGTEHGPARRWVDERLEYVKDEETESTRSNDLKNNNT